MSWNAGSSLFSSSCGLCVGLKFLFQANGVVRFGDLNFILFSCLSYKWTNNQCNKKLLLTDMVLAQYVCTLGWGEGGLGVLLRKRRRRRDGTCARGSSCNSCCAREQKARNNQNASYFCGLGSKNALSSTTAVVDLQTVRNKTTPPSPKEKKNETKPTRENLCFWYCEISGQAKFLTQRPQFSLLYLGSSSRGPSSCLHHLLLLPFC